MSDIILDSDTKKDNIDLPGTVTIQGHDITARVLDFRLDHPGRRNKAYKPEIPRRALVHGPGDVLVIDYADDYPEGVRIDGPVKFMRGFHSESGCSASDYIADHFKTQPVPVPGEAPKTYSLIISGRSIILDKFTPKKYIGGGHWIPEKHEEIDLVEEILKLRTEVEELKAKIK